MARIPINGGWLFVDETLIKRLKVQGMDDNQLQALAQSSLDRTFHGALRDKVTQGLNEIANPFGITTYTDGSYLWFAWTDMAPRMGYVNPSQGRPMFAEMHRLNHTRPGPKSVFTLVMADALRVAGDRGCLDLKAKLEDIQEWWNTQQAGLHGD